MTIAIVIGTHGWAAEQLLKTAEMLLGEQENVGWIDFVPGENAETLIEKYNAQLAKLDTTKGVLFLVDTWGGSPFNAASRIVVDKEHYEVIAGVNIPMLVETLMARDDDPSFFNRFGFQRFHAFTACFYCQRNQFIKAWVIITGH